MVFCAEKSIWVGNHYQTCIVLYFLNLTDGWFSSFKMFTLIVKREVIIWLVSFCQWISESVKPGIWHRQICVFLQYHLQWEECYLGLWLWLYNICYSGRFIIARLPHVDLHVWHIWHICNSLFVKIFKMYHIRF